MWTSILGVVSAVLGLVSKAWGAKTDADQQKVGAEVAENAVLKSGLSSIKDANIAAGAVNPAQGEVNADPNNLDRGP